MTKSRGQGALRKVCLHTGERIVIKAVYDVPNARTNQIKQWCDVPMKKQE